MIKETNFSNGLRVSKNICVTLFKKLKVLDQKVDTLYSLNKNKEAFEKQQILFHLLSSYSVILYLKNAELFQFVLSQAMKAYRSMLVQNYVPFDFKWRK